MQSGLLNFRMGPLLLLVAAEIRVISYDGTSCDFIQTWSLVSTYFIMFFCSLECSDKKVSDLEDYLRVSTRCRSVEMTLPHDLANRCFVSSVLWYL